MSSTVIQIKQNLQHQLQLMTAEQMFALGDKVSRAELIQGKLTDMPPTGLDHGVVELSIGTVLRNFVRKHQLGKVMAGEVGIFIQRDPDTIRAVDVAFISHQRLATMQSRSYLDVAPELVVEVLSPGDRWSELMEKIEEYFSIGVDNFWVADPRRQTLHIYRSLTESVVLTAQDTVVNIEFLPGFTERVSEFFE